MRPRKLRGGPVDDDDPFPQRAKREAEIEADAVDRARAQGWTAIKLGGQWNPKGWPDRLFIHAGPICVFIEFKRPGKEPTETQVKAHGELRALAAKVYVCTTADAALSVLAAARLEQAAADL